MKSIKYILLTVLVVNMLGCSDWDELNIDPNNPPADIVDPGLKVGSVFKESCLNAHLHQRIHNLYVDMFSHYYTGTGFATYENQSVDGWTTDFWNDHYKWFGSLSVLINQYEGNEKFANAVSVIKIWRVFITHRAVDLMGDLPYSDIDEGSYDSEEFIYRDMLKTLKEAVAAMDENKDLFEDPIYGGDVALWKKFGNSLRLRLAVRISGVDAPTAQQHAEEAVEGGVLEDLSEMPEMYANTSVWGEGYSYNYYFWWGAGNGVALTESMYKVSTSIGGIAFNTDDMENPDDLSDYPATVDPRLTIVFGSSSSNSEVEDNMKGRWTGVAAGLASDDRSLPANKVANNARINLTLRGKFNGDNDRPWTIMPISEVWFLRAEGALNGWDMKSTIANAYTEGVEASFEYWGLDNASDYLGSNAVNEHGISANFTDGNGSQLEKIITQKYIGGLPDNSWEAWADLRRLELPQLQFGLQFNTNVPAGKVPQRVKYPSIEAQVNTENYNKVKDKDNEGAKHWWAK